MHSPNSFFDKQNRKSCSSQVFSHMIVRAAEFKNIAARSLFCGGPEHRPEAGSGVCPGQSATEPRKPQPRVARRLWKRLELEKLPAIASIHPHALQIPDRH